MPKRTSSKVPDGAVLVRSYDDLHREVDAFVHNERTLLIVVGPPGTSKSTTIRKHVKNARIIEGGSTPYRLYLELYEHKDMPIILDDADKVFRDRMGVFLLKLLTQTDPVKVIQWNSNTSEIRSGEVPSEFTTTSRTMIVANSWPQDNPDIAAVESRGHLLYFVPSYQEMHKYARSFVEDEEVYGFIGEHLKLFDRFDLRAYYKAQEMKSTGLRIGDSDGWRRYVRSQMMSAEKRTAYDLILDETYGSDNQRAKEFHRITGMSSRKFYRLRDEIILRQPDLAKGRNACQPDNAEPGLVV